VYIYTSYVNVKEDFNFVGNDINIGQKKKNEKKNNDNDNDFKKTLAYIPKFISDVSKKKTTEPVIKTQTYFNGLEYNIPNSYTQKIDKKGIMRTVKDKAEEDINPYENIPFIKNIVFDKKTKLPRKSDDKKIINNINFIKKVNDSFGKYARYTDVKEAQPDTPYVEEPDTVFTDKKEDAATAALEDPVDPHFKRNVWSWDGKKTSLTGCKLRDDGVIPMDSKLNIPIYRYDHPNSIGEWGKLSKTKYNDIECSKLEKKGPQRQAHCVLSSERKCEWYGPPTKQQLKKPLNSKRYGWDVNGNKQLGLTGCKTRDDGKHFVFRFDDPPLGGWDNPSKYFSMSSEKDLFPWQHQSQTKQWDQQCSSIGQGSCGSTRRCKWYG